MEWLTLWFYLVLKLDELKIFFDNNEGTGFLLFICIIITAVYIVINIICPDTDDEFAYSGLATRKSLDRVTPFKKAWKYLLAILISVLIVFNTLAILIPSTKQAMALITVDIALKNKETAIKTGAEIFSIVDQKVEKYLHIISGEAVKSVVDGAVEATKNIKDTVEVASGAIQEKISRE